MAFAEVGPCRRFVVFVPERTCVVVHLFDKLFNLRVLKVVAEFAKGLVLRRGFVPIVGQEHCCGVRVVFGTLEKFEDKLHLLE